MALTSVQARAKEESSFLKNLLETCREQAAAKDYLDDGDRLGYRSYHFYIRIPTVIDIYGTIEMCLCEVQARTELQHVWADKSHDLMYKPESGWQEPDPRLLALMKQVSNSLRVADELLVDIRRRVRRENEK